MEQQMKISADAPDRHTLTIVRSLFITAMVFVMYTIDMRSYAIPHNY